MDHPLPDRKRTVDWSIFFIAMNVEFPSQVHVLSITAEQCYLIGLRSMTSTWSSSDRMEQRWVADRSHHQTMGKWNPLIGVVSDIVFYLQAFTRPSGGLG